MSEEGITKDLTLSNKQSFNRIKSVEAKEGCVVVRLKENNDPNAMGRKLKQQAMILTVSEAAQRATALNEIALKLPAHEAKVALDIVHEIICKCKEAQKQLTTPNSKARLKLEFDPPSK